MMKSSEIIEILDYYVPKPFCPLNYKKDYEFLMSVILSSQTTDLKVNKVTEVLFKKYDLKSLANADLTDIENIIKPLGLAKNKSKYLKEIANRLINDCDGIVPNDFEYLQTLPGVGRKSANVVLAELYKRDAFAVDTHVLRISKRLGIANKEDDVLICENKLNNFFQKKDWIKLHHQFILFGREKCKSKNPLCEDCKFKKNCHKNDTDF